MGAGLEVNRIGETGVAEATVDGHRAVEIADDEVAGAVAIEITDIDPLWTLITVQEETDFLDVVAAVGR